MTYAVDKKEDPSVKSNFLVKEDGKRIASTITFENAVAVIHHKDA
jgi:hypothetical protein